MTNAEGRELLAWRMRRALGDDTATRWRDRVVFVQWAYGVAKSSAQAIASGRVGKRRAEDIRALVEWEGRQGELPGIGKNDATAQDRFCGPLF